MTEQKASKRVKNDAPQEEKVRGNAQWRPGEDREDKGGGRWKRREAEREKTEMKTEAERNERDQRREEFTITLLGCTVIKAKAPRRAGRLRACPVGSAAALISSRVAHRNVPTNLQEDTTPTPLHRLGPAPLEESAEQALASAMEPAPLSQFGGVSSVSSRTSTRRRFFSSSFFLF